jgi:SAM-dependent methyltransferase
MKVKYDCGCVNMTEETSGLLHSIVKCNFHMEHIYSPEKRQLFYYKEVGSIDEKGIPQFAHYIKELETGFDSADMMYLANGLGKSFLELGPGLGQYIPLFLQGGATYLAVDESAFSVNWIRSLFYVPITQQDAETICDEWRFDCVFAAHLLEHTKDAPAMLKKMHTIARERLYLIVPDDQDPVNPDHQWFFTKDSLYKILRRTGFKNIRIKIQKIVPQEDFMYCVAEK